MPLVFVHGVNTRQNDQYFNAEVARSMCFREYVIPKLGFDPKTFKISNPYWGNHAANIDNLCIPDGAAETFGGSSELATMLLGTMEFTQVDKSNPLLTIAKASSLCNLVDTASASTLVGLFGKNETLLTNYLRELRPYLKYVNSSDNDFSWVHACESDNELIANLQSKVKDFAETKKETFGGASSFLHKSKTDFLLAIAKSVANQVLPTYRSDIQQKISRFIGDVFVYLNSRGTINSPGDIVRVVADEIEAAGENKGKEPLIVIAHSMGGNIVWDVLTNFKSEIDVDFFVTVGSQVSMFAELGLFKDKFHPGELIPKPKNISRWINVFDSADWLSYQNKRIFAGTEDYVFSGDKDMFAAHGAYFIRPLFYERLAERLCTVAVVA